MENALSVEYVAIDKVFCSPANPRVNDPAVPHVAASLKRFGWQQPIVAKPSGEVIAGNTRLKAAQSLGMTVVPVVWFDGSDLDATAYSIADNRSHEFSEWSEPDLAKLLEELRAEDALDGVGFDDDDVDALLADLDQDIEIDGDCDEDAVPEPPDEAITRTGDLWLLGSHRLLCGDSSKAEDVDRLLGGKTIQLINTDPPYNVKVEPRSNNAIAAGLSSFQGAKHHQKLDVERHPSKSKPTHQKLRAKDRPLENDFVSDEEFDRLLAAWFGNMARVLDPGRGFYIWGGFSNCANYPPVLKATGLYFSQAIIWDKEHPVLTRKDFMGAHEWCQPAGTKVLTPEGNVPIESLRDGDQVVSYSQHYNSIIGTRKGSEIVRTARPFEGQLLGVRAGEAMTWCTPAHLWTVRLADEADGMWCVYLMRKDNWWRVGKSRLITSWGFGLKQRLYTEGGDAAWILSIHSSSVEAALEEQILLAEYGIPLVTWSETASSRRTISDISQLYDRLDLDRMREGALRALRDHGRALRYPLLTSERSHVKVSRRVSTMVRACNLLPGAMKVPRPAADAKVSWNLVDTIDRQPFAGDVYSMEVAKHGHYIADGIVTHNCFYGWKEGAAHKYFGPKNATDLWHVKKVNPQSMVHLTEKPVELARRAIHYSSRANENVLDLFGGSGSTLIAAEQAKRNALLIEIDALYCDVIVTRWEKFSGKKAVLDGDGRTFTQVADERKTEAP